MRDCGRKNMEGYKANPGLEHNMPKLPEMDEKEAFSFLPLWLQYWCMSAAGKQADSVESLLGSCPSLCLNVCQYFRLL